MITNVEYLGNKDLLRLKKVAFLASNTISSGTVLKVYDWATDMRNRGECVVSGFCSKLEKDVLHFLLKGSQPIILVLARRMYKVIPADLETALEQNHLLIISASNSVRQSKETALVRNKYICDIADKILFVGVTEQSSLYELQHHLCNKQKLVTL
ncbi:hypothetical protein [Prevotella aurantiaca]|jgi:hypothetical protein|uniref:Smf/DprA SLOG domain-containing protein n=1 Tax=Prevotella aurantiaca TaxID=596085 RepID=A0A930MY92_9BACT|nr:hypothetical protein [Prevotella aurantiaca]MBF1383740.1 hypothetical protein [Prevotella aurantiaca]